MEDGIMIKNNSFSIQKIDNIGIRTEIWNVNSKFNGNILGQIQWSRAEEQYCFYTLGNNRFDEERLSGIAKTISKINEQYRQIEQNGE